MDRTPDLELMRQAYPFPAWVKSQSLTQRPANLATFHRTCGENRPIRNYRDTSSQICAMIFRGMRLFFAFPSCVMALILAYDNKTALLSYLRELKQGR